MNLKLFKTLTQEQRDIYGETIPRGDRFCPSGALETTKDKSGYWEEHTYTRLKGVATIKNGRGYWCKYYYGIGDNEAREDSYCVSINGKTVTQEAFNNFIRGLE